MPTDLLSTLVLATGGAFLGKFVGPAAESLGKVAWERTQQLGQRATAMLITAGREPQPVEPKILLPLVQAAALESDETLAEKWAALLANAADPAQRVAVQPGFAEVLRQLTPTDATVVDWFYQQAPIPAIEDLEYALPEVQLTNVSEALSLTISELATSTDNLLRLRLCAPTSQLYSYSRNERLPASFRRLCPSAFGYEFMQVCTPPTL